MRVGQAGWSVYKAYDAAFPTVGTHLERYSRTLDAVEINSSFYRPHQAKTYAKWADSVPAGFRFSIKAPQELTHARRLRDAADLLDPFLAQTSALGEKRGPLLFQLPPSFAYDAAVVEGFFEVLRARYAGPAVIEARHVSWFTPEVNQRLAAAKVGRVAADPALVPEAAEPGGDTSLAYYRWHGSPRMYYSDYGPEALDGLYARATAWPEAWVIFDNTAAFAAMGNALSLKSREA
ncbi:MAG: hypothetical protein JWM80_2706 [Cyanobacteria bacterium RYN_339]|nr:hypothetical protein [Cyanobacteria bacterium RYN_339]